MLTIKDIYSLKSELKHQKRNASKEQKKVLGLDIFTLKALVCEYYHIDFLLPHYSKKNNIAYDIKTYNTESYTINEALNYRKIFESVNLFNDDELKNKFDNQQLIELVKSFFDIIPSKFLPTNLNELFKDILYISQDSDACSNYYFTSNNRNIILLKETNKLDQAGSLTHEIGHTINDQINYWKKDFILTEFFSLFLEALFYSYCYHQIPEYKTDSFNLLIDSVYEQYENAVLMENYINLFSYIPDEDITIFKIKKLWKKQLQEKNLLNFGQLNESVIYITSSLVAIELLDQYNNDPNSTWDKIYDIFHFNDNERVENILTKTEIKLNEHSEKYLRELKKHQ